MIGTAAGGVERSPLAMAILVLVILVVVIAVTGVAMWREERLFHQEREERKRLRAELNRKLNDEELGR